VFEGLTFNGIVLPPLMSTKIWMLSAGNDLAEVEEVEEDDRERMMMVMEGTGLMSLKLGCQELQ